MLLSLTFRICRIKYVERNCGAQSLTVHLMITWLIERVVFKMRVGHSWNGELFWDSEEVETKCVTSPLLFNRRARWGEWNQRLRMKVNIKSNKYYKQIITSRCQSQEKIYNIVRMSLKGHSIEWSWKLLLARVNYWESEGIRGLVIRR